VVFAFIEAWRAFNLLALLHHPLTGGEPGPIYYVSDALNPEPAAAGQRVRAVFISDSYSALFDAPVRLSEPAAADPQGSLVGEAD
jgi:hypothetical protein